MAVEAWRLVAESEVVSCWWTRHWTSRLTGEAERSDEWRGDAVVVEWVEGWRIAMTSCCWMKGKRRKRTVMMGVSLLSAVVRVLLVLGG